jgi:hypothetical protein
MRLSPFSTLVFLLFVAVVHAEDWTTNDGKTYKNVKVLSHNAKAVTISCTDGNATFSIVSLNKELQQRIADDNVTATDWTTTDGKTYKDVKIVAHDDHGVTITDDSGGAILTWDQLPLDLQKKYGHDPEKIAAALKETQDAEAAELKASLPKNELEYGGVFKIPWGASQQTVLNVVGKNMETTPLGPDSLSSDGEYPNNIYVDSGEVKNVIFKFFHGQLYQVSIKFDEQTPILDPTTGKSHNYLEKEKDPFLFDTINKQLVARLGTPYNVDKDHLQNTWVSVDRKTWASLRADMSGWGFPVLLIYYNSELYGQLLKEQTSKDGKDSNDKKP